MSAPRVLLTGASGQIGRAVTRALAPVRQVITTSRRPVEHADVSWRHVIADQGEERWSSMLVEPAREAEIVVLLASRITTTAALSELAAQSELEIRGPLALLERLPHVRHVIYASSYTVYGATASPVQEGHRLAPASVYACVKASMEELLRLHGERRQIGVTMLRIAQVFGPGSPSGEIVARTCDRARSGAPLEVTCGPEAFRDYVHEDDVAAAVVATMATDGVGAVNIGSGTPTRIAELAATIARAAGRPPPRISDTSPTFSLAVDVTRAREVLAWSATRTLEHEIQRRLSS